MRVLLIVDDDPFLSASKLLDTEKVTHLLCDQNLGSSSRGQDLLVSWRSAHPSIVFAALMSGAPLDLERLPEGIDAALNKPIELTDLLAVFAGR